MDYDHLVLILLIPIGIYEGIIRIYICKKIIQKRINELGGTLLSLDRLSGRKALFSITFKVKGEIKKSTVKFDFFLGETWY